jgi:hypothetical protein
MNAAPLSSRQAIPLVQMTKRTPRPLDANDTRLTSIAATPEAVQMLHACDHHQMSPGTTNFRRMFRAVLARITSPSLT